MGSRSRTDLSSSTNATVSVSGGADKAADEYTNFQNLARRLVQVPKSEIDAQRKKG